jgi:hypothetical protein
MNRWKAFLLVMVAVAILLAHPGLSGAQGDDDLRFVYWNLVGHGKLTLAAEIQHASLELDYVVRIVMEWQPLIHPPGEWQILLRIYYEGDHTALAVYADILCNLSKLYPHHWGSCVRFCEVN